MSDGVAYHFWHAIEQRRVKLGWTKGRLSAETANFTPDGKVIPRSTIDNLRTSTRVPQARIINALASTVGLDQMEAAELAGAVPPGTFVESPLLSRIGYAELHGLVMESGLSDSEKLKLIALLSELERSGRGIPPPAAHRTAG